MCSTGSPGLIGASPICTRPDPLGTARTWRKPEAAMREVKSRSCGAPLAPAPSDGPAASRSGEGAAAAAALVRVG